MNLQTKYYLYVILILLECLVFVMSFECYVGENSDYQALRCLSCQVHTFNVYYLQKLKQILEFLYLETAPHSVKVSNSSFVSG